MKYPALDIDGVDEEFLLALVDDFVPAAADTQNLTTTIFFSDPQQRDLARDAVLRAYPGAIVIPREVDDGDWARRSQADLKPVTVGNIRIVPEPEAEHPMPITLVIAPSMGFGTGHHATTRICLRALQHLDLSGRRVLDVGTGSGVLAIAARALGAREAIGIDDDRDAIQAAQENLAANPMVTNVTFRVQDLRAQPLPQADVITANLTGALLIRSADLLLRALVRDGSLIVSGLQTHERDDVVRAFGAADVAWERSEDEWIGILFRL